MFDNNNIIITGTLKYGRLLNKLQKNIFIGSISVSLLLILISFLSFIYFDKLLDWIIFIIFSGIFAFILMFFSCLELKYDKKNRNLISYSMPDIVVLQATLKVLRKDWNGSKKIQISFRYKGKRVVADSNKYIKLKNTFEGKINILYSDNMNSVIFFTCKKCHQI